MTAAPANPIPASPRSAGQAFRGSASLIDPRTLMRIKGLELRARAIVQGFMSGLHRSPYHGFSVEFTEYRQYTVGDDPRYIDWKLYARSDRLYVKRFEDETNLRCWLLVDNSKSMHFGTVKDDARQSPGIAMPGLWTKADYAATLAATFAYFLSTQRDAAGLVSFDEDIREYLPARYRPGHLRRLMVALERTPEGKGTNLTEPLKRVADLVTKRGIHVLISDLLAPLNGLETHLGYLRSRGHEVMVFHLLDPAELSLAFDDAAMFYDVESQRELYVDPDLIRKQYTQRMGEHLKAIEVICDKQGVDYHRITTDTPLELALFDFLSGRQMIKRTVMRRQGEGRRG
ncbi:MAG: DUF58 domain-containing protein [Phycisphaeraceae bacterium]